MADDHTHTDTLRHVSEWCGSQSDHMRMCVRVCVEDSIVCAVPRREVHEPFFHVFFVVVVCAVRVPHT